MVYEKGIWIRPGGCNLAGWLRTEKRNDNDNCTSCKDYDCRVKIDYRKDFSGIVEAVEYVKLAFRVNGQIIQLPVIEGQKVKKGQLIAAIDPRDIALQMPLRNRHTKRLRPSGT